MCHLATRVPNRLRKHRRLMGYRQKDVAKLLGFENTRRIGQWERGLAVPNLTNLLKLSIIYRTFPNELYFDLLLQLRHDVLQKEERFLKKEQKGRIVP